MRQALSADNAPDAEQWALVRQDAEHTRTQLEIVSDAYKKVRACGPAAFGRDVLTAARQAASNAYTL